MSRPRIHRFDTLTSTQDEAHRLAGEGAPHGTAAIASIQTGGRGTRGREWISGRGGLWLSVVCRPRKVSGIETLSLRTGVVLAEWLEHLLPSGTSVALKWPNDLMIGDAKVGGILAEARWQGDVLSWVVVGAGINVQNVVPTGQRIPATSLAEHGATLTADQLADPVVAAIALATEEAPPLTEVELAAFRARDWLLRRELVLPHGGVARGITAGGRLQVLTTHGALVDSGGTVELRPAP